MGSSEEGEGEGEIVGSLEEGYEWERELEIGSG